MKRTPMARALLQSNATKNAQLVSVEPDVKSSKTRELFNAGVSENPETGKSADPTCYNSVTVEFRTGLFENWRETMDKLSNEQCRSQALAAIARGDLFNAMRWYNTAAARTIGHGKTHAYHMAARKCAHDMGAAYDEHLYAQDWEAADIAA